MKIEDHQVFKDISTMLDRGDYVVTHKFKDWREEIRVDFKFGWFKYFRFEIAAFKYLDETSVRSGAVDSMLSTGLFSLHQFVDNHDIPHNILPRVMAIMKDRIKQDAEIRKDRNTAHINYNLSKL